MREFDTIKFVKWAGGKGQLLDQLIPLFPKKFNRYIEPFVGSGAVLFYILQKYPDKDAIISDVNDELITAYRIVKERVEELIKKLKDGSYSATPRGKGLRILDNHQLPGRI